MVSFVEVSKAAIIERLRRARIRIHEGMDPDRELTEAASDIKKICDDLDRDIKEVIDMFW